MSFKLVTQLSLRNIMRYKRRNVMLFVAIAMAVAGVSSLNTIIRGFQADVLNSAVENLTGHVKIHAPGYRDDPNIQNSFGLATDYQPDVPKQQLMGWAPRIRVPAVIMSERQTRGVQLVGVEPQSEDISFISDVSISGESLTDSDDGRVLIGAELARQLETQVGRRLVILTQGADGLNRERGYRIAGLYDAAGTSLEKAYVFTGLTSLQNLLDSDNVTEVSVRLHEESGRVGLKAALADFFLGLDVRDWQELEPQAATMFVFADTAIFVWFILLMSALVFGLVNTLVASVMERGRELGMLRALGMRKRLVVLQVVVESLAIMVVGMAAGLVFGYLIFLWISDGIDLAAYSQGIEQMGISSLLVPVFRVDDFVLVAVMSLGLGLLASLYPAWRAMKVEPLEAMRS